MRAAGGSRSTPYDKVQELVKEMEAISHSNKEQERLQDILKATALQMQDDKTNPEQPHRDRAMVASEDLLLKGWDLKVATTRGMEENIATAIGSNNQEITGASS